VKSFLVEDKEKRVIYLSNIQYIANKKQKVFNKSEEKWRKVEKSGKFISTLAY